MEQEYLLNAAQNLLDDLRGIIKNGLNSGRGDGEWEALVVAGEMLGVEYNDEEGRYE